MKSRPLLRDERKSSQANQGDKKIRTFARTIMNKQSMKNVEHVKRGEIYFAQIFDGVGSEQSGTRPVLILQNDIGNRFSSTTIVAFLTSINKKLDLPVHEELPKETSHLPYDSVILLEQIRTLDKERLIRKVSTLDHKYMTRINEKLKISLGMHPDFSF
ncbi:type II toxin-antitoxin system PemK/MazF family toxin (plasmid) [Brevibacillus halotolerans]|nr:type II toxin-antitoxin system PemK/MazF family toxin [Brevibacillus halotolerans]